MPEVSLIASSIRPQLYKYFFNSLKKEEIAVEVVFAGPLRAENFGVKEKGDIVHIAPAVGARVQARYLCTENIKPAQCYEVARRNATGEVIVWVADDCEFKGQILTKAYKHWKSLKDDKVVLSLQTKEYYLTSGNDKGDNFCNMALHSFYGGRPDTPRMAPLGMMSRKYLERLGGLDRRYVCGQYENDIVMRVYQDGGRVEMFGDRNTYIDIDHVGKEGIMLGRKATWKDFQERTFATSYKHDRRILEQSWCGGVGVPQVKTERTDKFEPYEEEGLTEKSQSFAGRWK